MSSRLEKLKAIGILIMICCLMLTGCQHTDKQMKTHEEVLASTITSIPEKDGKVLIVTGEYPPYVGEKLNNQGFLTEMIENTLKNCDFDYEIKFYPWARCREMVKKGLAWASYPYGDTKINRETYLLSNMIYSTEHRYYYRKDNKKFAGSAKNFDSLDDFTDFVFGGANAYWYGNRRDILNLGVKAEWAEDSDALLKMLYTRRIDFMIEDELVCKDAIHRLFPEDVNAFATLETEAKQVDYYMLASKYYPDSEKLLKEFNEEFLKTKSSESQK
ncbi:substrate-binding periplasmic protein [Anaerocolumna chitinilytica]|uniref:Solute-binding protein family 3/N-terminal domain-containing protein n=1 Tax=Anaerocolumna chitinilytica TaxID=1727145 RepID=A0A7I8DL09_9FIRM|nr:transporter substrate-binding domain-containing protein [Anaerocolumna chitinilytica]BCJ99059.1 hypothetical protein bsdcttw_21000 [Anaerocolumna chitinilytica]